MDMRRLVTGIAVGLLGLVVLPAFAVDKDAKDPAVPDVKKADDAKKGDDAKKDDAKKDDKKEAPKKEEASSEKLIVVQTLIGKLIEVNETKKSVRIQTNIPIKKGENLKVEVVGTDGLQIRQADPPVAYDEKGRPRKHTHKELKDLKGDSKLPGYPGAFTDLHTDQYVVVTIVKKKETPVHHVSKKEAEANAQELPETNLIEIVSEPPAKKQ